MEAAAATKGGTRPRLSQLKPKGRLGSDTLAHSFPGVGGPSTDVVRRHHQPGMPDSFFSIEEKAGCGRARQRLGLAQACVDLRQEFAEGLVPGIGLAQGKDQSLGLPPASLFAQVPDDRAGHLLGMMPKAVANHLHLR